MQRVLWTLAVGLAALPMAAFAAGSDQEVAQQIADSLRQSGRLKGYSIAVKYKDGTARLEGTVRSQQQADQAADMVNRHPSVKRLINNLAVDANPVEHLSASNQQAAQPAARIDAIPASASQHNAGLMPRPQQGVMPAAAQMPMPAAGEQPFRQASRSRPSQPTPAPGGLLQQIPGRPLPLQSLLSQPPQPIQGRVPPTARPMGQMAYAPNAMPGRPMPASYRQPGDMTPPMGTPVAPGYVGGPSPEYVNPGIGTAPAVYDQPYMPNYAWPSYAPYPNYAALTYPKQYSPTAWPYIGPFYPYPQVPLGWRKVTLEWETLEWDDGWWFLNFADDRRHCGHY
jgi:hypothetical protein